MSAPHKLLDGAVHSLGSATVLRPFFERLDAGRPVTLLALGSSITTNRGGCTHMIGKGLELERRGCCGTTCHGEEGWLRTWFDAINATWPHGGHRLYNAGTAASTPLLFTECAEALPRTLDAHTREHASVRRVAYLKLGGAGLANCVVELTTLDRSSSGGFKWKLVRLSVGLALE